MHCARPLGAGIAIPGADQTPEMLAGLAAGTAPEAQFARRLTENGCLVLVPVLVSRQDTFSGNAALKRFTNQPHREWIYRQAFELLKSGQADAFADLRDALLSYQPELPDSRIIPGNYGSNALAIGFAKERPLTAAFVKQFTEGAIASGFVTRAIEKAGVRGAVAPGL